MSASEAPALLFERDVVRCNHLRQRHPLHQEALLICAWPGCPEGTRNHMIHVAVEEDVGRTPTLARFERETLPQQSGRLSFRWKNAL
jgi:hypothetical protein